MKLSALSSRSRSRVRPDTRGGPGHAGHLDSWVQMDCLDGLGRLSLLGRLGGTASMLVGLGLACALAGCVQAPRYQPASVAQLLPGHVDPPVGDATAWAFLGTSWWRAWGDPAVDELVATALAHSPDLEAADASIRQSRAYTSVARGQRDLQLNADGRVGADQFSRNSENFANIPTTMARTRFDETKVGLDASWELDVSGRLRHGIEAAQAREDGARAAREDAALRVGAETVRDVVDARYWRLRADAAREILEHQLELLRLTRLLLQAGQVGESELQAAQANVNTAQAALPPLRAAAHASAAALMPLTALPLSRIEAVLGEAASPQPVDESAGQTTRQLAQLPPHPPESLPSSLPSGLLQRRADLRQAERELAAATADIGVAVADQYPRFDLVGAGGWDSIHLGTLTQQASHYWDVGPQITWPLLSGGQVRSRIDAAQAARDRALAEYRHSVLLAMADVETAMLRCSADQARLDQIRQVRLHQDKELELTRQRVAAGETPRMDLVSSEMEEVSTRAQALEAEQSLSDDLVTLIKAAGGP